MSDELNYQRHSQSHSHRGLYPHNTSIKDFAYDILNPLRHGHFPPSDLDSEPELGLEYDEARDNIEINQRAIALFDFTPENDNEVALTEGQTILISYRHGQGWLVAEDPETGENGLVPEEYVELLEDEPELATPFLPEILQPRIASDSEWVDTDDEDLHVGVEQLALQK